MKTRARPHLLEEVIVQHALGEIVREQDFVAIPHKAAGLWAGHVYNERLEGSHILLMQRLCADRADLRLVGGPT